MRFPAAGALALLGLAAVAGRAAAAAPAPAGASRAELAAFFRRDAVTNVRLAPDGAHLAYTVRVAGRQQLSVMAVDTAQSRKAVTTMPTRFVAWANAATLVFSVNSDIWAVDIYSARARLLADNSTFAFYVYGSRVARRPEVIRLLPGSPARLLLSVSPRRAGPAGSEYYTLDIDTGASESRGSVGEGKAVTDLSGRPRLLEPPVFENVGGDMGGPQYAIHPRSVIHLDDQGRRDNLDWYFGDLGGLRFRLSARDYFGEATVALGFGLDPRILYVASNVGRGRFGFYALDTATRRRAAFAVEDPLYDLAGPGDNLDDSRLVVDRDGALAGVRVRNPGAAVHWIDPGLASLQSKADAHFPGRRVEIVDWSEDRERLLVLVTDAADPGRYFVFNAPLDEMHEYLRLNPAFPAAWAGETTGFEFDPAPGRHLTGRLTLPAHPAVTPPPVVVYCRDFPGEPRESPFNPDVQALSALGFAVLEIDHRGTAGFGMAHRDAITAGVDTVPLEDIRAGVAWAAARYPINGSLVGLVGEGLGGFVAIRALELYPEEFRCAVAINAPADLSTWVATSRVVRDFALMARREYLASIPGMTGLGLPGTGKYTTLRQADRIRGPVMLLENQSKLGLAEGRIGNLLAALQRAGADVEYKQISSGFDTGAPEARGAAYESIGGFLRASFYDYDVNVGAPRPVK